MTQPTSDIIEDGIKEFGKKYGDILALSDDVFQKVYQELHVMPHIKSFLRSFAHRILEAGKKEGAGEERERVKNRGVDNSIPVDNSLA